MFGMGSTLYTNQPHLALVSNGAECLMMNKKFFLDNATDECLRGLREMVSLNISSLGVYDKRGSETPQQSYGLTLPNI